MKEIVKSKIMIGFFIFIIGFTYINIPTKNYDEGDYELTSNSKNNSTYNI